MSGLNQTGPVGQGPMTGRRLGRCTNFGASLSKQNQVIEEGQNENQTGNFPGRGFGMVLRKGGRGRGMGRQKRFRGGF